MEIECYKCGDLFGCDCWRESRKQLPPLGEVIEGIGPKNWFYSRLGRDYFALVEINSKLIWITPSLNDMDYNELEITHWRRIPPDPKGKRAFVKIMKKKKFWIPKVIFEKDGDRWNGLI